MVTTQTQAPQRRNPTGVPPLPMAIGVLGLPAAIREADRRSARLDLALLAYKLGYFVVDIVELPTPTDTAAHDWIAALAEQTDADAFVCAGDLDTAQLDPVADRMHMVIRTASPAIR